jgi:hypothetical protein
MNVLLLNHKIRNCGVYQYGHRIRNILEKSTNIMYDYQEVDSYSEYANLLARTKYDAIIYNYCAPTMPWLNINTISKSIKSIGLIHPNSPFIFNIMCNLDPSFKDNNNHFCVPRPICENSSATKPTNKNKEFIEYGRENIPIFGSFGFACGYKGFVRMIEMINQQYDDCVIKIVMPSAAFYPTNYFEIEKDKCFNVKRKKGIKLVITNNFFTTDELLLFLGSNTMNIFLYDYVKPDSSVGISSVVDLAISVDKPIAISGSYMFRHIYSDDICLSVNSIRHCLLRSNEVLEQFRREYSHSNFLKRFEFILQQ